MLMLLVSYDTRNNESYTTVCRCLWRSSNDLIDIVKECDCTRLLGLVAKLRVEEAAFCLMNCVSLQGQL